MATDNKVTMIMESAKSLLLWLEGVATIITISTLSAKPNARS
ncbi:predicted protein [Sclerotinia sclerotiorum 1980 UF-70]|uniref:Uncharacterized protein n=1 Tax=Sclerotinia sclerotiorum (strain ATCC 18683 / 1980 / Ss-1) TaxID=665079 RepID=A7E5Z9_SCLS1|nr:predicted protein [Sclerotinia sclerotiorum 1980 UF-70]EDN91321.1 predicted protein [Sclerotinia sclerotiorum 1980 UF-70]